MTIRYICQCWIFICSFDLVVETFYTDINFISHNFRYILHQIKHIFLVFSISPHSIIRVLVLLKWRYKLIVTSIYIFYFKIWIDILFWYVIESDILNIVTPRMPICKLLQSKIMYHLLTTPYIILSIKNSTVRCVMNKWNYKKCSMFLEWHPSDINYTVSDEYISVKKS